jgi:hypothetical protein
VGWVYPDGLGNDGTRFGVSNRLTSMSYTDMNEGIWFSYILGPAADGIFELLVLCSLNIGTTDTPSILCLDFLSCAHGVLVAVLRSGEGGVIVTAVNDLFKVR